jgi:hypothetical protein
MKRSAAHNDLYMLRNFEGWLGMWLAILDAQPAGRRQTRRISKWITGGYYQCS